MPNETLRQDAGLGELLATRARAASDTRLLVDVLGGLAVAAAALTWRPFAWFMLANAAFCFAAFGTWGIADRELHDPNNNWRPSGVRMLKSLRVIAAIGGALATASLLLAVLALGLGKWRS